MIQLLLKLLSWTFIIYCVYCGILFVMQRRIIYPAHLIQPAELSESLHRKIEPIWIQTRHGKTETWFIPAAVGTGDGPTPAIILAHGNAELIDGLPFEFDWLAEEGVALLFVEYPGYGRSEGNPSRESIMETFLAAYDMLVKCPGIDPDKIILFGRSLGGGAICTIANKRPSAGMILISTFTDTREFASGFLVPRFLVLDIYDNFTVVKNYANPIAVFHGKYDELIPYHHAQKLSAAAARGTLTTYAAGHNDCPPDNIQFRQDLLPFFKKTGITLKDSDPRIVKDRLKNS